MDFLKVPVSSLLAVGDVHGYADEFRRVVDANPTRKIVQLGDLVDRGPDSAGALSLAMDLVRNEKGTTLRGNHDDKLARHLKGNRVQISPELQRTIDQVNSRPGFTAEVLDFWQQVPWWLVVRNWVFVHGGFHPAMLEHGSPDLIPNPHTRDKVKNLALRGEAVPGKFENGFPVRTYSWIDEIPSEINVVVGHDVRSTRQPLSIANEHGGVVTFLDTGCGKGGRLSTLAIDPS